MKTLAIPKPLSNIEVFQLYIRMSNAHKLSNTTEERDILIKSILDYVDYNGFKPFSTIKGETNYPQQYDYNCINKFRIQFSLEPYTYKEK